MSRDWLLKHKVEIWDVFKFFKDIRKDKYRNLSKIEF